MNYGELLGEAFRIAWRTRYLWFFGLFISGGETSLNISVPPNPAGTNPEGLPTWLIGLGQWARENVALALILGIGMLLVLLLVFLGFWIISAGGLAETVSALHRGERRSFASTWRAGVRNFWRVFLYLVLLCLIWLVPLALIGSLAALGIFGIVSAGSELLRVLFISLIIPAAFALLLVVSVPLYLVQQLALRELVIGGRGLVASVGSGYRMFRHNLGRTILVWLIQFGIALAVVITLSIVGSIIGIAQAVGFLALSGAAPYPLVVGLAIGAGLIVSLPLIVLWAAFGVFNHAYWTLAYLRLTAQPTPSPG